MDATIEAGKRYRVDWTDPAFPRVVLTNDPEDAQTLSQCKQEITDHFRDLLYHARDRIRWARNLRKADL